jgi:hypothetical protein
VRPLSHLTSCTPTTSKLYLANPLATVLKGPRPTEAPRVPRAKSRLHLSLLTSSSESLKFRSTLSFYGEELLAPLPISKLERNPLSAVREGLFSILATTLRVRRPSLLFSTWRRAKTSDRHPLSWSCLRWSRMKLPCSPLSFQIH